MTSNTPKRKTRDILHDLEEIRKKLQENFTWKEALEEQQPGELILLGERGLNMEVGGNDKNNDKWLSVGGDYPYAVVKGVGGGVFVAGYVFWIWLEV